MIRCNFTQIDLYFCCIRRYCAIAPCSIIKYMIPSDITARVAQLRGELQLHNYLYYVMQSPSISDSDFDELFRELQDLESQYPESIEDDSPTQRVGGYPSDKFKKVDHPNPILSLRKVNSPGDTEAWFARISKLDTRVISAKLVVEPKIDGLTVVLHYENGVFIKGCTRGDGYVGEDITRNLRTVRSLPLRVPVKGSVDLPSNLVVRGEAFIPNQSFQDLNDKLAAAGERTYINARNAASGALRQLDPRITASRPIALFCYEVVASDRQPMNSQWDTLNFLRELGFPVSNESSVCDNIQDVIARCEKWSDKKKGLDYEIDGVVIKVDDLDIMSKLGVVGKDPRGAVAYKFAEDQVSTQLVDIGLNIGRTGVLTPYAVLKPVKVGGVIVKQATLHNLDFVRDKDIRVGDHVLIKRAGEVIPYVIGSLELERDGSEVPYEPPDKCPSCGTDLNRLTNEVAIYCANTACPDQIVRNLEHFVSRATLEVDGFGKGLAKQLVEAGLVTDVADIFSLDKNSLMELEGFAHKKVNALLDAIAESKKKPLNRLVEALGIRGVGSVASVSLTSVFGSLDALGEATSEQLQEIEGLGPNISNAVVEWFDDPTNRRVLDKLQTAGFWPTLNDSQSKTSGVLAGTNIVITGTLQGWSRKDAVDYIESHGGAVGKSITSNTNYLLVGDRPGSKLDRARNLGIKVIDVNVLKELAK